jgi:hypothetical protein
MDSSQWLERFPQIASGIEMVTMIQEGARIMADLMSVDELGEELRRQQALIARLHNAATRNNQPTEDALHAMFLSFGTPEADIPRLIIRAQTCGDTQLVWESMEVQYGARRVAPFRQAELCDGIHHGDEVVIKRKNRGHDKTWGIKDQCQIQRFAHEHLTPKNGFTLLYTPQAWYCALAPAMFPNPELYYQNNSHKQYEMERIDVSNQILDMPPDIAAECAAYEKAVKGESLWPRGYELFRQPDGRVALISFGRFGRWDRTTIEFPWGEKQVPT